MKFVIDIDGNLFTRLFDNGEELNKSDREELEAVIRNAKPLQQKKSHKEYSWNAENRLSLKHLIEILRMEHEIEIRNEDNYRLFNCPSNSQALEPYLNRKVIEWFADRSCKLVVLIGETE